MAVAFRSVANSWGNGSSSNVVTKPAGVVADDVLIAVVTLTSNTGTDPITPPSDWVLLQSVGPISTYNHHASVYVKVAGSSEPTSYTWSFSPVGSTDSRSVIVAYSGGNPAAPVDVSGMTNQTAGTTAATPSLTTSGTDRLVMSIFTVGGASDMTGTPTGTTSRFESTGADQGFSVAVNAEVFDLAQAASGATGSKSVTKTNGLPSIGATVALRPANRAPNAPTLVSPVNSVTIDRNNAQRFAWTFSDPDGDSQSKYDLQYRVIGAGTWTAVTDTTPNQLHDFAAATFAAGDYEWQVRTYDAGGTVGPYSASSFFTAATPPTGPTITDPINGATISSESYTLVWSISDQDAYQVRKVADAAGVADTATVYSDSGTVESETARSHGLTFPVNNRTEHLQVRVRFDGLWSTWASVSVAVSYTPPAVPTVMVVADDASASIGLLVTNPAPGTGEPTVTSNEVHVRVAAGGRADLERTVDDDGIRVATGVALSGTWTDRAPSSGVVYEYRVRAVAANGTSAWSAWTP